MTDLAGRCTECSELTRPTSCVVVSYGWENESELALQEQKDFLLPN